MSAEHRRPLFAFVTVFLIAMLVVVNAARSEAFRDLVRQQTAAVVAGAVLDLTGDDDAVVAEPRLVTAPAATVRPATDRATATKGHHRTGQAAPSPRAEAHRVRGPQPGTTHGSAQAHRPAKAHAPRSHDPVRAHGPGHGQAKAHANGHANGKGHHQAKGKGHSKHRH